MILKVRLLNLNKFDLAEELDLDMNKEILTDIEEVLTRFSQDIGVSCGLNISKITDKRKFEVWILSCLFSGYRINDTQGVGSGYPDYELSLDMEWKGKEFLSESDIQEATEEASEDMKKGYNNNKYEYQFAINRKIRENISKRLGKEIKETISNKYNDLKKELYVEVKWNSDGLRANQVNWMLENKKSKQIFILFIKEEF